MTEKNDPLKVIQQKAFEAGKLSINATYEELEAVIPEVAKMKGFDQRSDFHDLILDEHTKKMAKGLEEDQFLAGLPERNRDLVLLAGKLHDLGKMSSDGQQVHKRDPDKLQYAGHEKESARIVEEILPKYFDLSGEEAAYVSQLTGLHATALNLVNNFETNNQPVGRGLKSYDDFLKKAEGLPGKMEIIDKMRIILAINKADKQAGFNESSDSSDQKVEVIRQNSEKQVRTIEEIGRALPALVEAIMARRGGDQTAGIVFENGEYKYKKPEKKAGIPEELRPLGRVLRDKMKGVAEAYATLQTKKGNERALSGVVEGVLRKKLGLNEEQVEAVLKTLED